MENTNQEEVIVEETPENKTPMDLEKVMNTAKDKFNELTKAATPFVEKLKSVNKKVWIAIAAAVVVLIAAIIVIGALNNTYSTPVKLMISDMNSRKAPKSLSSDLYLLNGFMESEYEAIFDIIEKADEADRMLERMQDNFEESVESLEDKYGENYKYSYTVDEKEELEKSDLRAVRENLRNAADNLEEMIEETEEWDSDDWEDAADEIGLTKSQMKNLVKAMEDLKKVLDKAEVTEGYELSVLITINGDELDEPEETERTIEVYKIDGRWVSLSNLSEAMSLMYGII